MAQAAGKSGAEEEAPASKGGGKAVVLSAALALLLGGGGFYGVYSGLVALPFGPKPEPVPEEPSAELLAPASVDTELPGFVPLETMVISLAPGAAAKHLKIRVEIEVDPARSEEVAAVAPRIRDVLVTFLRAVDAEVIERPAAMARLRAQMLRRVQLVAPQGAVRAVLIQEFVIN